MTKTVELPLWVLVLLVAFAAVTFASHFLFPSVRWFFRKRLERAVAKLNQRLERPIEPFRLARRFDMIQRLIYDPVVSQAVVQHARKQGIPENVAFETARRYAGEIVPSFSATMYFGFAIRAARLLSNALYHVEVDHLDEDAVRQIDKDATVVFVMNHRSNMDYVLVTHLAAQRSALSYAVGEWANVWPLNRLIRAMGAYFIRRGSLDDLYRTVLARYVFQATTGRATQAMFPEGGLSLDGKLRAPKLGLLKYFVQAHDENTSDIIFVPVGINYDRVLEDRLLLSAQHHPQGRFSASISVVAGFALKQCWFALTGRYFRFGTAAVRYGHPLSLTEFRKSEPADFTHALGEELMKRIAEAVPALPVPLLASVMQDGQCRSRESMEADVEEVLQRMTIRMDADAVVANALELLGRRRILVEADGRWHCPANQQEICAYYGASLCRLAENANSATAK